MERAGLVVTYLEARVLGRPEVGMAHASWAAKEAEHGHLMMIRRQRVSVRRETSDYTR